MTRATCPYCCAPYTPGAKACGHCDAQFPWAVEAETLRQEMKERETNRGRATATLLTEVIEAGKGGKPVSIAAVKGFAFAWLFPRTMIVIGSVLATLLLAAQTWVIWNQTSMLEAQAKTSNLDRAEKLRLRIEEATPIVLRLSGMRLGADAVAGPTTCADACLDGSLQEAYLTLNRALPLEDEITVADPSRAARALAHELRFNEGLMVQMESAQVGFVQEPPTSQVVESPKRSLGLTPSDLNRWRPAIQAVVRDAVRRCAYPAADARALIRALQLLDFWITPHGVDEWRIDVIINESLPRNIEALKYEESLEIPLALAAGAEQPRGASPSYGTLKGHLRDVRLQVSKRVQALWARCSSMVQRDVAEMEQLEGANRATKQQGAAALLR
ncbi:hypothetical protein QTI66_32825 [Variovorax sp. J22R133]|uniref:hypothetical protein n=1 Tax=Variovorax brevis TaxID=3053503 RepID=UPI0025769381|nr:hypothetical protein [Variovorax sp. J22R133]MDM0116913.1 hypothetical protein [Variovorax sp. J22R133]